MNRDQGIDNGATRVSYSSPIRHLQESDEKPRYSLLATFYLDGRSKPERRIIVYTDPADKGFNAPYGKVCFGHRWIQSRKGSITEHAWVFKEKAIESVFDRLMISNPQVHSKDSDENTIAEAIEASAIDRDEWLRDEKSQIGQIVVEVKRVTPGEKRYDSNYRSKHQEDLDEDIDVDEAKPDVTHATGSLIGTPLPRLQFEWWIIGNYKPGEGLWATFQFFYRSAGMCSVRLVAAKTPAIKSREQRFAATRSVSVLTIHRAITALLILRILT